MDTLLIRLTTNTPRRPCLHCGTDLATEPDWEKRRVKIAGESARRSELTDRQVDTISTCVLFLLQFPLWQCTNTDSYTSSESASEIRLSWPSFIEYSGQPLDRSWTPGQPKLNPSHVNTEYDSASEQSDSSKHSTGEQRHTANSRWNTTPTTQETPTS